MTNFNYIVLEGIDGCGKTTLAKELAKQIGAQFGYEPCGETRVTKQLRELALQKEYKEEVNAEAREYLMLANRAVSTEVVRSALLNNKKVVQDRSAISGMVYAHVASGYGFYDWWEIAYKAFKVLPDVVINVEVVKQNIAITDGDIYDDAEDDFHKKIKETFPDVLEWFNYKHKIPYCTFVNSFDHTPEENAKRLIEYLTHFEKTI